MVTNFANRRAWLAVIILNIKEANKILSNIQVYNANVHITKAARRGMSVDWNLDGKISMGSGAGPCTANASCVTGYPTTLGGLAPARCPLRVESTSLTLEDAFLW